MRLVVFFVSYGFGVLFFVFVVSYLIWLRRIVLDIPVGLRFGFSVLPALLLYRAVTTLHTLFVYRHDPQLQWQSSHLAKSYLVAMGLGCLALFHIWRGVKRNDFTSQRDTVSLLGRCDAPRLRTTARAAKPVSRTE